MKNGLLVWNVILTLVAGYLLYAHFSKKENGTVAGKNAILYLFISLFVLLILKWILFRRILSW
jgi:hypothetical protein